MQVNNRNWTIWKLIFKKHIILHCVNYVIIFPTCEMCVSHGNSQQATKYQKEVIGGMKNVYHCISGTKVKWDIDKSSRILLCSLYKWGENPIQSTDYNITNLFRIYPVYNRSNPFSIYTYKHNTKNLNKMKSF